MGPRLRCGTVRVLLCVPAYAPALDYGGPVTKIQLLARELIKLGVEVEILTANFGPKRSKIAPGRREVDDVPVTYLRRLVSRGWLSISPGAGRVVREGRFDVVHCFGLRDGLVTSAGWAATRAGIPVVLEPMGMAVPRVRSVLAKGLFDRAARGLLRRPAATIATSELEADELRGLGFESIIVRYNPVPATDGAHPATKVYDLCYVGRLHRKKQLHVIADVLAQRPTLRAIVAGPDEDGSGKDLASFAASLGIGERLEIEGWLAEERREQVLAKSRCFVLPSLTENFGNAAAEALRAGVPVVVTDQCGIAEIVERSGAGVVSSVEPASIVAATLELLDDSARLAAAASASISAVEALAPDRIAHQQAAIYKSVVGDG
jgi:glycosyltransferase involved in cell wall biosynthesis